MMTKTESRQEKLVLFSIDSFVSGDHFLRKLDAAVDFNFIYDIVNPLYSNIGRPSIDPVVLIKMLLVGYLYGIDSERKLEDEIRYNLAYRWFLGMDIDDSTPDHSTISQNRRRRFHGNKVFRQIFEAIVQKCVEAGLVNGENIVMDSTHIKANADNHTSEQVQVTETIDDYWLKIMDDFPYEKHNPDHEFQARVKTKNPYDPEAGYMNRTGKPRGFHYLTHQCSDADTGIIIDVAVTSGDVQDCECCVERFEYMKQKGMPIKRAALDKAYDTIPVHHGLSSLGIESYISVCDRGNGISTKAGKLSTEQFIFYPEFEKYKCPNGCELTFRGIHRRNGIPLKRYVASAKDCKICRLQEKCFKRSPGKNCARHITRALNQEAREAGLIRSNTKLYTLMMRKRQAVCEGNFALQKRCHNLRFTRKRGKENVLEQCLLSATALNLQRLVRYGMQPLPPAKSAQVRINQDGWNRSFLLHPAHADRKVHGLCKNIGRLSTDPIHRRSTERSTKPAPTASDEFTRSVNLDYKK